MEMMFGKYKGLPVSDLPESYLIWLFNLDGLREPLFSCVRQEIESRGLQQGPPQRTAGLEGLDKAKKAYRRASMQCHPDRQNGDTRMMQGVNLLYSELKKAMA